VPIGSSTKKVDTERSCAPSNYLCQDAPRTPLRAVTSGRQGTQPLCAFSLPGAQSFAATALSSSAESSKNACGEHVDFAEVLLPGVLAEFGIENDGSL
jgi:hypothetical protein